MRVHGVNDEGYHVVAAHYVEVAADKERIDTALTALQNIGDKPLRMELVQHYTAIYKNKRGKTRRRNCRLLKSESPTLLCTIQTRNRLKPINAYATYSSDPGPYTAPKPQPSYTYDGEKAQCKREGHGIYFDSAGNYYDGFWANDMREGFGCSVDSAGNVRVGQWKENRFRGERLNYTSERIYGIDIARYQHEVDGGVYPIIWKNLRITSLGVKTPKTITGTVSYPVSFVFIKSTEGTTVLNKWFASDYAEARKNGIRVGAYHFFSTKSDPLEQAHHFLKNTKFSRGDLPPVLDVEPSDAQIEAMGGAEKMFEWIRTWMRAVEKATGVRPILYINQMFVNRYMPLAPDVAADYEVWIARYNEFKPDMHLSFWQLGYDGRLSGIRGDVDINVFNGYQDEWQAYLKRRAF
jgi:lysozyme